MPYSPSIHDSPMLAHGLSHKADRPNSSTPPQPAVSKRDKKRNLLTEKLNDLTTSFANNRDAHYRSQLQALQVDMQLIMRADPYRDAPLDDMGDDVDDMVALAMGGVHTPIGPGSSQIGTRRPESDAAALAGRWYMQFVEDVNNAMEDKDAALTMLEQKHQRSLNELYNTNRYKIRLAQEEHAILGRTIRERLVQSIQEKKKRLMREKEHLDVADSNALLLHPSQFSITNPSSPGGPSSNRKTRHTRHRGEADEVSGTDGNKRKRKAALDDDIGSPGPSGRVLDTGTSSPFRDAKARLAAAQFDSPLYSIDKLFTEKELGLTLNLAATAATNFFASENTQGPTKPVEDAPATDEVEEDALAAPELDRLANMSHHATRSSKKDGSSALNLLGDLAISEKNFTSMILPASVITKTGQAPTPPPLSPEDAQEDILKMDRLAATAPGTADPQLMADIASSHYPTNRDVGDSMITRTATAAIPMSTQSSLAGFSEGGYAMKRDEGSSLGSAMMKRTASGAGFSVSSEAGKRVRNR